MSEIFYHSQERFACVYTEALPPSLRLTWIADVLPQCGQEGFFSFIFVGSNHGNVWCPFHFFNILPWQRMLTISVKIFVTAFTLVRSSMKTIGNQFYQFIYKLNQGKKLDHIYCLTFKLPVYLIYYCFVKSLNIIMILFLNLEHIISADFIITVLINDSMNFI